MTLTLILYMYMYSKVSFDRNETPHCFVCCRFGEEPKLQDGVAAGLLGPPELEQYAAGGKWWRHLVVTIRTTQAVTQSPVNHIQ